MEFIQETGDYFHIEVACYPAPSGGTKLQPRVEYFKQKVDAGANAAITQYFYNVDTFALSITAGRRASTFRLCWA